MRLLHPALWFLLGLRYRARLRRVLRDLSTVRGIAVYAVGWGAFVGAFFYVASLRDEFSGLAPPPDAVLQLFQSGLLGLVVVGQIKAMGERAIYFSPSEVDFLFQAPFARRELLAYRVVSSFSGIFVTAFVLSLPLIAFGGVWQLALIGTFLSLLMVHLLSMCLAVLRETLEERAFSAVRRAALVGVSVVIAASIVYGLHAEAGRGFTAVMSVTNATWGMQLILAPFYPFAQVATASALSAETVGWIALCVVINAGLFAALMRIDANYLETASNVSERLYARTLAARMGRLPGRAKAARYRLPLLPRLGGAGTVAWWQLTAALRGLVPLLEMALLILVIAVGVYLMHTAPETGEDLLLLAYVGLWATLFISNFLRFDFRCGADNLPSLKILPCPSFAICVGQLVTPVVITTVLQLVLAAIPLRSEDVRPFFLTAIFSLPINTICYATENIAFLLYPSSAGGKGPADFQFIGRQMLLLFLKLALLVFNLGAAAIIALALFAYLKSSVVLVMSIAWIVLAASAIAMVWLLAIVFRRFDPSCTTTTE